MKIENYNKAKKVFIIAFLLISLVAFLAYILPLKTIYSPIHGEFHYNIFLNISYEYELLLFFSSIFIIIGFILGIVSFFIRNFNIKIIYIFSIILFVEIVLIIITLICGYGLSAKLPK